MADDVAFVLGYMMRGIMGAGVDPLYGILGIIGGIAYLVIAWLLCWNLAKTSIDDLPKVAWVIIFFLMPILSWVAYWLVVKKK